MAILDAELEFASAQVIPSGNQNAIASTNRVDLGSAIDVGAGEIVYVVFTTLVDVVASAGTPRQGHWFVAGATDAAFTLGIRMLGSTPPMGDVFHFGGALPIAFTTYVVPVQPLQRSDNNVIVQPTTCRYLQCYYRNLDSATTNYAAQTWRIYATLTPPEMGRIYPASTSS